MGHPLARVDSRGTLTVGALAALFGFTVRQTLRQRKLWVALMMVAAPCALALVIRYHDAPVYRHLWQSYHVAMQFLLMTLILPLICILYGTSLIGAEVEERTLVFLLTRRLRRATVLLVRFAGVALVLAVLLMLAAVVLHFCTVGGLDVERVVLMTPLGDESKGWDPTHDLLCYLYVIPIAVVAYLSVFSLAGLVTSKPIPLSIAYYLILELMLGNLPITARVYTILHQLQALMVGAMPQVMRLYELPDELPEEVFTGSGAEKWVLAAVVVLALGLCCALMSIRELLPSKIARE